jgi:hypothetical protein
MIIKEKGRISDGVAMIGHPGFPGWLITHGIPALFDSGVTVMGPLYFMDLKQELGDPNRLQYNFITHAHFDHAGASPYLKRMIPGLKIAASRIAAETLKKENAIRLIRKLNAFYEETLKSFAYGEDVIFQPLEVDRIVEDGETIDMEGYSIKVIARAHAGLGFLLHPGTEGPQLRGADRGVRQVFFGPAPVPLQLQGLYQVPRKAGRSRSRPHHDEPPFCAHRPRCGGVHREID